MGQAIEIIKNRRTVRKYKQQEVSKDLLKKVLDAANWAPSDGNSQPWEFIITKGEYVNKICDIFYGFAKQHIPNAPYIPEEKKAGMLEYAKNFGGALTHIAVTYEVTDNAIKTEEALMAASAAIENLLIAASDEGLGTVWIAGPVLYAQDTINTLGIPENRRLAGIIPIGYPDMVPAAPERVDPGLTKKVKWLGF